MQPAKILQRALNSPQNIRFADAIKLAQAFGFRLARIRGGHHILKRSGLPELLMLEIVETYSLILEPK